MIETSVSTEEHSAAIIAAKIAAKTSWRIAGLSAGTSLAVALIGVFGTLYLNRQQLIDFGVARAALDTASMEFRNSASNIGHTKWELTYATNEAGNVTGGTKAKLLEVIKRGCPVRVTFSGTAPDKSGIYYYYPTVVFVFGQEAYAMAEIPQVMESEVGGNVAGINSGASLHILISTVSPRSFSPPSNHGLDSGVPREFHWYSSCGR